MSITGWRWAPVPRRILSEEWFLDLDDRHRTVLLSLYLAADKNGVVPAGPLTLARLLGLNYRITDVLRTLHVRGAVVMYSHEGRDYLQISNYKEDRPARLAKDAPDSGWVEHHVSDTYAARTQHVRDTDALLPLDKTRQDKTRPDNSMHDSPTPRAREEAPRRMGNPCPSTTPIVAGDGSGREIDLPSGRSSLSRGFDGEGQPTTNNAGRHDGDPRGSVSSSSGHGGEQDAEPPCTEAPPQLARAVAQQSNGGASEHTGSGAGLRCPSPEPVPTQIAPGLTHQPAGNWRNGDRRTRQMQHIASHIAPGAPEQQRPRLDIELSAKWNHVSNSARLGIVTFCKAAGNGDAQTYYAANAKRLDALAERTNIGKYLQQAALSILEKADTADPVKHPLSWLETYANAGDSSTTPRKQRAQS